MTNPWFLSRRICEAMKAIGFDGPMSGEGSIVKIDQTFIGNKAGVSKRRGYAHKHAVTSLVERRLEGAAIRSFQVSGTVAADLVPVIKVHVSPASHVMTDEGRQYFKLNKTSAAHDFTTHNAGDYARGIVHTNTVKNYYGVFKRGIISIYKYCVEYHLHRYVAEFDFHYNNRIKLGVDDKTRAEVALIGVKGKWLIYRTARGTSAA